MAEQIRKKPRARASLDGKRLTPMIDDAEKGRIIAERTRLHERAQSLLADGRISETFYDTVTDAMNRAGSLQELRGLDTDLDGYADQPTAPNSESPEQRATEAAAAQETTPEKLRFASTRERGVQRYYVFDENAEPANSFIESGTGRRLRPATPEEMAVAARQLVNRDSEGPRILQGTLLPGDAQPESAADQSRDDVQRSEPDQSQNAQEAPGPTGNEDIEGLLQRLGSRTPEQRRQMMQRGAGERTPEERRRRILERNGARRRSAGPEQTPSPSDQEQHETERAPGTPPPLTPEQIEYSRRTSGGGAEQPPNEPPPPGASDTLQQPRGGRYEGAKKKGYILDDREYAGLKPPTLKEIWADSIQQHFFGEMLRTIGTMNNEDTDAIVARYARDEATPDDLHFMNYVRHEYWKWTDAWEKLCKDLSDVDVDVFMRRNQMMKSIVGHVGNERGLEVLKQMLRFTAMRDQQTFQDIEHALHHAHEVRDTYLGRRAEKKINHLAGEIGVDRAEYHKIVNFSSDEERRRSEEDIENRLHKKADGVRKAMDWMYNKTGFGFIPGTSHKAMKQFVRRAELAERGHFGRTGKQLDSVAASMGHAGKDLSKVVETREVISMVSQEALRNERRVPEYLSGPKSIAEVNATMNAVNEQGLKQIITQRTQQPDYVNGTPAYQNSVISDLRKDAEKTLNAGTGFMSWILKMLFGSKFNKAASEVTGRTIH